VDFEYAAPNPSAYDIGNHFHEWTANYHSDKPHVLDTARYPTLEERQNFYHAYLSPLPTSPSSPSLLRSSSSGSLEPHNFVPTHQNRVVEDQLERLDDQVRVWSPASHAVWTVWGIVQAKDDLSNNAELGEFDYLGYAKCRVDSFRREIAQLGIHVA